MTLGTSASYPIAPNSTQDDVTTTYNAASGSTSSNVTATETKNTIKTTAQSGCANGDKASLLSGTTVPTQTNYAPAFSIGIIFNSNLMKSFSGIFK